jgi:hypothetical protein
MNSSRISFLKDQLLYRAYDKAPDFLKQFLDQAQKLEQTPATMAIPDPEFVNLSPGMQRYWEVKRKVMDCVLFYRFGDYYVMYFDDLSICN